jgi:proteasome-associated ATPase
MSGTAPSIAAAGSIVAGTPATPTRNSFLGCAETGIIHSREKIGQASTTLMKKQARSTFDNDIALFLYGGTCRGRHPFRGKRDVTSAVRNLLVRRAARDGAGAAETSRCGWRNTREIAHGNAAEGLDNLDFLFYSRLYSVSVLVARARAAHGEVKREKGWAMKEFDKKSSPGREGFSKFLPASMSSDSSTRRRLTEYEIQVQDLQAYVRSLEAETVHLRKKLEDTPKDFMVVENKLREANRQLVQAFNQNEKLVNALYEAREQITALKEEVDKLCAPPSTYGVYLSVNDDGTVNILAQGRKVKVNLHPSIKPETIKPGQELVLNEGLNVVETAGYEVQGDVVILKEQLDPERAVVTLRADEEKVGIIADPLRTLRLKTGDHLLMDAKSGYLLEKLPKSEVEDLSLEEVPDIGYEQIGGLGTQIEAIKDAVELPYLYADYYKEHKLTPPKGVLLYGPPGCGKTMIAKAVANNLAEKISEKRGEKIKGFFLNIKGPELLNKYVGETERKIREIFVKAKEKANEDVPVVVFFDEMDALFRTRGTGISSDVETTIVPQLLAEIDGVEGLKNVIVIGASNRQDLIDPAILRPGRLDVKIKIERPDQGAASDIFHKYLTTEIPIAESEAKLHSGDVQAAIDQMLKTTIESMYNLSEENRFLEVTYANGDKEVLYFKDFSSGAMIESVVRRAKKLALKRYIGGGEKGITADDLLTAVREEFKENEDLPNTTNPDDWAKIAGKKGERIVYVKPLMGETQKEKRNVERVVNTGQYL